MIRPLMLALLGTSFTFLMTALGAATVFFFARKIAGFHFIAFGILVEPALQFIAALLGLRQGLQAGAARLDVPHNRFDILAPRLLSRIVVRHRSAKRHDDMHGG